MDKQIIEDEKIKEFDNLLNEQRKLLDKKHNFETRIEINKKKQLFLTIPYGLPNIPEDIATQSIHLGNIIEECVIELNSLNSDLNTISKTIQKTLFSRVPRSRQNSN